MRKRKRKGERDTERERKRQMDREGGQKGERVGGRKKKKVWKVGWKGEREIRFNLIGVKWPKYLRQKLSESLRFELLLTS